MRYFKEFYRFLKHIVESRKLLFSLAYNDFQEQYLGSYLGAIWSIIRPILFIAVIWFIFGVGFKSKPTDSDTPFILWLLCGLIPWFFFAEAFNKGSRAIVSNAYLVKKVAFRLSILPIVKILSSLIIHIIFLVLLLAVCVLYNYKPTIYWLQIPYYLTCNILLLLGLGWLTSALRVFIKDIGEIISVIIQFGFWLTPIFWSLSLIPSSYHAFVKLNPMYYIIDGYRSSLLEQQWFWSSTSETLIFLSTMFIILVIGAITFKRLKPHFGDVL